MPIQFESLESLQGETFSWKTLEPRPWRRGGNSFVYQANSGALPGQYAIKVFSLEAADERRKKRFFSEIEIVKKLRTIQGCAQLTDHGIIEDRPFYVMPLYSGGTFFDKYMKGQPSTVQIEDVLEKFTAVVRNVHALHSLSPRLAVRDIKPQNIFIDAAGNPVIGDFGLALWSDTDEQARHTPHGASLVGSSGYRAPEWADAYPDPDQTMGDIWSLGRTLWAICARKHPPSNFESLGTKDYHLKQFLGDDAGNLVQGLVNGCTKISIAERFTSTELVEELEKLVSYFKTRQAVDSLERKLERLKRELPGSSVVATAEQRRAELNAKKEELDGTQQLLRKKFDEFRGSFAGMIDERYGKFLVFAPDHYTGNFIGSVGFQPHREPTLGRSVYIQFQPAESLALEPNVGPIYFCISFGLKSDEGFYWIESDKGPTSGSMIAPIFLKSLSTVAAQKCGQLESMFTDRFLKRVEEMIL